MNRNSTKGNSYAIQWETHPKNLLRNFCSLMEHQSLVDVVVCCGNNTIQAHKFVLAANSPMFREEFEKNPLIEQIVISGCDYAVIRSIIEIMYCGKTIIAEDNVKFLIATIKMLQMKHLEKLFNAHTDSINEDIYLPKPQFLTKKPKYPTFAYLMPPQNNPAPSNVATSAQQPITANAAQMVGALLPSAPQITNATLPNGASVLKPVDFNIPGGMGHKPYTRGKRTLKQQAEQACVKEAQASRMALASLQKEIAAAPQVNSFIIEDTCTETTVENFIPSTETAPYVLNFNDIISETFQNSMFLPVPVSQSENPPPGSPEHFNSMMMNRVSIPPPEKPSLTAEKLKYILGAQVPANVEIMYKDADGNFVPVNEEVLQNLATKEGLQYQVVDEDGRVSEMQELHVIDKLDKIIDNAARNPLSTPDLIDIRQKSVLEVGDFLKDTESSLAIKNGLCSIISKTGEETTIPSPMDTSKPLMDMPSLESVKSGSEVELKFSPDIFFADIMSNDVQNDITVIEDDIFVETAENKV